MSNKPTVAGVCSGVGGFDLAFHRAGFDVLWACEIDKSCQCVVRARFPDLPIYIDMAGSLIECAERPQIFVGGTPCQGFSVAGLRKGLNDDRSNLSLRFVQLCDRFNPEVILWENVPGVLSMADNAFGCFLAGLVGADAPLVPTAQCGGRWTNAGVVAGPKRTAAWRVLDSQYFGVAQRRQRVFVVASPRVELPFQVLFEPEGVRRHSPPRRETGQRTAPTLEGRAGRSGCNSFATSGGLAEIAPAVAFQSKASSTQSMNPSLVSPALDVGKSDGVAIAFTERTRADGRNFECQEEVAYALTNPGSGGRTHSRQIAQGYAVRRLTPRECERLQGFPDDWTLVENTRGKPMADGPRYKQMGNAVTVNIVEWLARRIKAAL